MIMDVTEVCRVVQTRQEHTYGGERVLGNSIVALDDRRYRIIWLQSECGKVTVPCG